MREHRVISIAVGILLVSAALVTMGVAPAQQAAQPSARTITVVGQGQVTVEPDIATAQIGVEVVAPTVKEATEKNRAQMQAVLKALKDAGVAETDIQTSNYSIHYDRQPMLGSMEATPSGQYRVSNMVQVRIRNLNAVGNVLDAAVEAGANTIWGVSFGIEDTSEAESAARAKAMDNARAKAAELARLANVEVGEVVSISEVVAGPYPVAVASMAVERGFAGSPISPGELTFQTQLQVVFAIQ